MVCICDTVVAGQEVSKVLLSPFKLPSHLSSPLALPLCRCGELILCCFEGVQFKLAAFEAVAIHSRLLCSI